MKFGFIQPSCFRGEAFENVDRHTYRHTDDRGLPYYNLTNEPKGLGELRRDWKIEFRSVNMTDNNCRRAK